MIVLKSVFLIISFLCAVNAFVVLKLKNPTTKYGFVYPNRAEPNSNVTYVHEGVDVLIYLAKVPENYAECKITTKDADVTYTLAPGDDDKSSKVVFWTPNSKSTGCGARIKNVTINDSGRWRLQAINDENDHLYQSFIHLKVIKNFDRPNGDFIIKEGWFNEINITKYASYCEISDPVILEDHKIFDKCKVDLQNINEMYEGRWKVKVGVLGKIDEIILQPNVQVLGEQFDVGFNKSASNKKINLYCNLKNAENTNVTFCRFIRNGSDIGLRLSEGLSNGEYSYFGINLKNGDCGLTIENPKSRDYVVWKCTLGLNRQLKEKKGTEFEIKEGIISLKQSSLRRKTRSVESDFETISEILAGNNSPLNIYHETDFRIKYCIIIHPNGTQYAINSGLKNEIWASRGSLSNGQCGMRIFVSTVNETGLWKMQIGHYNTYVMDKIVHIPVRVGEKAMVAIEKTITAEEDSSLTIKCKAVSSEPNIIEYCRFTLPDGSGFQIDEKVTINMPIDNLYWYNGTSLKSDGCQVSVTKISSKHYGTWFCSGKIKGSINVEDYDTIEVISGKLSIASISGIAAGSAAVVIVIVGGFIYYRKKTRQPQRRQSYLSSSRSSQGDINVFERNEPLVQVEEQQPEIIQHAEHIEMTTFQPAPQSESTPQPGPSTLVQSRPSGATSIHSTVSENSAQSGSSQLRPEVSSRIQGTNL